MTKYRGFRKDGKGWVEGCPGYGFSQTVKYILPKMFFGTRDFGEVDNKGNTIIEDTIAIGGFIPIVPESLGISVGLSDKNGKEIFGSIDGSKGGDVLMYIGTNMSSMDVIFQNGMFVGVGPFNTHSLHTYLTASDFQSIEIIGNQYEQNG